MGPGEQGPAACPAPETVPGRGSRGEEEEGIFNCVYVQRDTLYISSFDMYTPAYVGAIWKVTYMYGGLSVHKEIRICTCTYVCTLQTLRQLHVHVYRYMYMSQYACCNWLCFRMQSSTHTGMSMTTVEHICLAL